MIILRCRNYVLLITHVFEMSYSNSFRQLPFNLHQGIYLKHPNSDIC